MKNVESLLRWVSIVLFTILAAFVTVPTLGMIQNAALRRMNPFTFWLCMMFLLWFIVVRFLFQDFYRRGQLSGGVKRLYEEVLEHPFRKLYKLFFQSWQTLSSRMAISALSVLCCTGLIAATDALDNLSFRIARAYEFMIPRSIRPTADGAPGNYAAMLQMTTPDNNKDRYLEACLKTALDLKATGARVIVMELPWLPVTEENLHKVDAINNTGIVVFGTRFQDFIPTPEAWRLTQQPLLGKLNLSWGQFTFPEKSSYRYPSIFPLIMNPFIPYGTTELLTRKTVPDVGIEALRKYVGASDIRRVGDEVVVGNLRLPVTSDGVLLSHSIFRAFPLYTFSMAARVDKNSSSVSYMVAKERGTMMAGKDLKQFEDVFRDKIVFLRWDEENNPITKGWSEAIAYTTLFNNALGGKNLLRKSESGPLYLTFLSVLLCAIISRYLRGSYAVPLMLLLGVGLLYGSLWLWYGQSILLDASYPLVALVLSIAILPLARFSYMMRTTEGAPWAGEMVSTKTVA